MLILSLLTPAGVYQLVKDCRGDFTIFRLGILFTSVIHAFAFQVERGQGQ